MRSGVNWKSSVISSTPKNESLATKVCFLRKQKIEKQNNTLQCLWKEKYGVQKFKWITSQKNNRIHLALHQWQSNLNEFRELHRTLSLFAFFILENVAQ